MEKCGIQNALEVLDLVEVIGVAVGEATKENGFQLSDLLAFLDRPQFREKFLNHVSRQMSHYFAKYPRDERIQMGSESR